MDYWDAKSEDDMKACEGQDINARKIFSPSRRKMDYTPLADAVLNSDLDKCKLLLAHGAIITPGLTSTASCQGDYDIFIFLIDNGGDINDTRGPFGNPMATSCAKGFCDIFDFLVSRGVYPDENCLLLACINFNVDILDRIMRFDITLNTSSLNVPLIRTLESFQFMQPNSRENKHHQAMDIIVKLLMYGADVNMKDFLGKTALIFAAKKSFTDVVKILLHFGADKTSVDENNKSAYDYAHENNHIVLQELLRF